MPITWRNVNTSDTGEAQRGLAFAARTLQGVPQAGLDLLQKAQGIHNDNMDNQGRILTETDMSGIKELKDLAALKSAEGMYTDANTIRGRISAQGDVGQVTQAYQNHKNLLSDQLYSVSAAAAKAKAEQSGSIAAGAEELRNLLRAGHMDENAITQRIAGFMQNDLGLMGEKNKEAVATNTREALKSIDMTKLSARALPGIWQQLYDKYGASIDMNAIQSTLTSQLGLQNADDAKALQRQMIGMQMKSMQVKPMMPKMFHDGKTGNTTLVNPDGSDSLVLESKDTLMQRATEQYNATHRESLHLESTNKEGINKIYDELAEAQNTARSNFNQKYAVDPNYGQSNTGAGMYNEAVGDAGDSGSRGTQQDDSQISAEGVQQLDAMLESGEIEPADYLKRKAVILGSTTQQAPAKVEKKAAPSENRARAGAPDNPNWEQELSRGSSTLSRAVDKMMAKSKAMTHEQRKAAEEARKLKMRKSFGGQ